MRCCAKILDLSSSNQIEKDQCEKLQKFILNLESAEIGSQGFQPDSASRRLACSPRKNKSTGKMPVGRVTLEA
jgi:hypothetical protein